MRVILFIFLLIIAEGCKTPGNVAVTKPSFAPNPVIAHRGAFKKNGCPENSIASLKEAIRLRCTGSEFDVRMTSDDSLVVNHDPHYNKLLIEETTYADLVGTPLSNGEKLPTLREYIRAGLENNSDTRLVLEIKPSGNKERGMRIVTMIVDMVKKMDAAPMTTYISFDYDMVKKIQELDPNAPVQYLNGDKSPEQLAADGIRGMDYHFSVFKKNPDWIASAKKHGIILNAWTVNDSTTMDWLLREGFDFITTNEPELLLERGK